MQFANQEQLQRQFFGQRFVGASLCKTSLPDGADLKTLEWIKNPKNFLVLIGPPGTGKTYFCSAILAEMVGKFNSIRAHDERSLLTRIRKSISGTETGDYLDYLHGLINDEFLIIDDIGSSGYTDWRGEILMEAIDYRYESMLPTVLTSNLTRQEFLNIYGRRIESRIFATENLIIDLTGTSSYRSEGL